jgi:hypothetical protein
MSLEQIFDYLVEYEICTDDELSLVTNINGWNEETANSIIWARTGYRDIEQLLMYEDKENYRLYFENDEEEGE